MMLQQKRIQIDSDYVPRLGDKVRFAPSAFLTANGYEQQIFGVAACRQDGEVCYINEAHHYYRVRYAPQGVAQYECFKF